MPRSARASGAGICYHVINRGNGRRDVFRKEGDYEAFLKSVAHACIEVSMPVLGFCLLPNHFHLVVWPQQPGDLSRWMHWLLNTHVRRYHQHYYFGNQVNHTNPTRQRGESSLAYRVSVRYFLA